MTSLCLYVISTICAERPTDVRSVSVFNFVTSRLHLKFFFSVASCVRISAHSLYQAIRLQYPRSLLEFIQHPSSLRCVQTAAWSLACLEPRFSETSILLLEDHSFLLPEEEQQVCRTITSPLRFSLELMETRPNDQTDGDPFISALGDLSPLGGLVGYLRVAFQVVFSFSKYFRICDLLLNELEVIQIVGKFLGLIMGGAFHKPQSPNNIPKFSGTAPDFLTASTFLPNSPLRLAVVDALLIIEQCVSFIKWVIFIHLAPIFKKKKLAGFRISSSWASHPIDFLS